MSSLIKTILPAMFAACLAGPTFAAPITYFTSSVSSNFAGSIGCNSQVTCQAPNLYENVTDVTGGAVSSNRTNTFPEGEAVAFSSGDLSTGSLRASASITTTGPNSSVPLFSFFQAGSLAQFGDSFRTFGSNGTTPFNWNSSTEVSFSLDVSGLVDLGVGASQGAELFLSIYAPGDLDAYGQFVTVGSAPAGSLPTPLFGFDYALGSNNSLSGFPFITSTVSTLPSTLTATFNPGGDFDWVLGLVASTSIDAFSNPNSFGIADFSNTVVASYTGPQNSVTRSGSGLFPGTLALTTVPAPVPLPAGFPLLVGGLGLLAFLRRKSNT